MHHLLIRFVRFLLDNRGSMRFRGKDIREFVREVREGFGGSPSLPLNSVQFNLTNTFKGSADFRFIQASGVLIGQDIPLNLSSNAGPGDHYWKYNSATDYTELYTDGALRAQF